MKVVGHLTDVTSYGLEPNESVVKLLEETLERARSGQVVFTIVFCGAHDDCIDYESAGGGPTKFGVVGALEWAKIEFMGEQNLLGLEEEGEA